MPAHERTSILAELSPPFTVARPARQSTPFVLCSPHSGRVYTRHFLDQARLDPLTLRKSEDCFVDELFAGAVDLGAPLLSARFPRAYLDVNREPFELDPELFDTPLPEYANSQSIRVIGGLGTIARVVADGEEIYRRSLSLDAVMERIELLYTPFHEALAGLLEDTRRRFGYAVLIDCHSMPSALTMQSAGPRPDFVLGDRFGSACDHRLTRLVRDIVTSMGYDVQINRPYAGGYITENYGRPQRGLHAIQIEVNRGLYLDEATMTPNAGMARLRHDLTLLAGRLFEEFPLLVERRAAAE